MCWVLCSGFAGTKSFNLQNKYELLYPQFLYSDRGEEVEKNAFLVIQIVNGRTWMQPTHNTSRICTLNYEVILYCHIIYFSSFCYINYFTVVWHKCRKKVHISQVYSLMN